MDPKNRILVRTVDLESTDFPPEGQIIEAGHVDSICEREHEDARWEVIDIVKATKQKFFKPDKECTIDARATHHIHPSEYAYAEHHLTMPDWLLGEVHPDILCAHNAPFEQHFIKHEFWIDTYKVALRLYPDFPRHTNQYLRYALGLQLGADAMPPHRALPDAYTTAHILAHIINRGDTTIKQMIAWSRELPYLTRIGFGKHFGKRYDEVPRSYLSWVLGEDFDPEVHAACRRVMGIT